MANTRCNFIIWSNWAIILLALNKSIRMISIFAFETMGQPVLNKTGFAEGRDILFAFKLHLFEE